MNDTTSLLQQLVAIDSVNPDLVPNGAGEKEIAIFISNWLEQAGLTVEWDEPQPGRPSVVGIAHGTGGGRSLMLNAHMDTVGVSGMERPHQPFIEGNRLYGRGAFDMKGGLAAAMIATARARQAGLRGDVILTAVADEEYASLGTQSVLKRWTADAAIVTEPTDLQLCLAHKGFIWQEVITQGRAAHGSRADLGLDAIAKMGHVLVGLERLHNELQRGPAHPLLGHGSLHASIIRGGQEWSSYPEQCVLQLERRTIPGETINDVETQLQTLLNSLRQADPAFQATARTILVRDAFEVAEDAPIVQVLRHHAGLLLENEPPLIGATPWMDSALLAAAGISTVVFGPGGAGAHAVVEWADLQQVEQCADILFATIQEFCR